MASYTFTGSDSKKSNADSVDFSFDISSGITAANIPPYSRIDNVTVTVWGDIDTASNTGKMNAYFGSEQIGGSTTCGGSSGEKSVSETLNVSTFFNSQNANAGKLKDSSVRLTVNLNGPFMLASFNHSVRYSITIEWTPAYLITWKNYDNSTLATNYVLSGATPTYSGSTPTKANSSDGQFSYTFSGWSPSVVAATGNATYTAQFTEKKRIYKITLAASPENSGTVSGFNSGNYFEYGTTRNITATPNEGYVFKQWSDGNTDNPRTVTVTGEATYTAEFINYCVLTLIAVGVEGWNSYSHNVISGSKYEGVNNAYAPGSVVRITANAEDGYVFSHWEDGSTDNPRYVTMSSDVTIQAYFEVYVPPEFVSAQLLYSDKQVSQSNKVKAGEGFRIIIDVQ